MRDNFKVCKCKSDCFNKDKNNFCHLLTDTSEYKEECPFAKSGSKMLEELLRCSERVGIKASIYRMILKQEVFDTIQYRNIFEVTKNE